MKWKLMDIKSTVLQTMCFQKCHYKVLHTWRSYQICPEARVTSQVFFHLYCFTSEH